MKLQYEKPTVTIAHYQLQQYMGGKNGGQVGDDGCYKGSNYKHGCEHRALSTSFTP